MNDCVLSVSIAAYNVEKYLNETLKSFINSNILDGSIEVLIINDGSTDNSIEIAKKYVNEYPKLFKLIDKKNGGWGSTVNSGLMNANGKYFKQLDGDDYYVSGNLPDFIDFLKKTESDLVISPYHSFSDNDGRLIERYSYKELIGVQNQNIDNYLKYYPLLQMHAACFRTNIIKNKVLIEEHCFYTDVEFMVKAISHCYTLSYFDEDVYCYRLDRQGQSMSIQGLKNHYKEHEKITLILSEYCTKFNGNINVGKAIKQRVAAMIDAHYQLLLCFEKDSINKNELIDYDSKIKKYPDLYKMIKSKKVFLLRNSRFWLYPFVR